MSYVHFTWSSKRAQSGDVLEFVSLARTIHECLCLGKLESKIPTESYFTPRFRKYWIMYFSYIFSLVDSVTMVNWLSWMIRSGEQAVAKRDAELSSSESNTPAVIKIIESKGTINDVEANKYRIII